MPVGFNLVEVNHGGRLSAMGGVGPLVVVEVDPHVNAGHGLRAGLPGMKVGALKLQGPPEALDETVVELAPLGVHRDPGSDPFQPASPGEGRELQPQNGIHGPNQWIVSFSSATQKPASRAYEVRQPSTLWVNQSVMATKERNPRRIGK